MTTRKRAPRAPTTDSPVVPVGTAAVEPAQAPTLQEYKVRLTPIEEKIARLYVLYNNATKAYIEATGYEGKRTTARHNAWEIINRPNVQYRIREYESAAAAAVVVDYAAILDHDRAIVEGFKHADQISEHIIVCCRYCHGVDFAFQWVDFEEYLAALTLVNDQNATREALKQRALPMPSDRGGYGFDPQAEPNIFCPRCEGRGEGKLVLADTTKLTGPARAAVIGAKFGKYGPEIIMHDVDKAKERLLRAGGIFKDDAASVAKGAAAGAAAGVVAATIAGAKAAQAMTTDEAQKLYLELA